MYPDLNAALCNPPAPAAPSAGEPSSLPVSAVRRGKSVSLLRAVAAAAPTA